MYFDAVLDAHCNVLFNGTPKAVKEWLKKHKDDVKVQRASVALGRTATVTSVENYLQKA